MNAALAQSKAGASNENMTLELFLAVFFTFASILSLDVDIRYAVVAFIGAASGSIVLAYFKPEPNRKSQLVKAIMSTISGIIVGAAFSKYYSLHDWEFLAMAFFFHALVSLILLKAIVSFLDTDGGALVRSVAVRVFNISDSKVTINQEAAENTITPDSQANR